MFFVSDKLQDRDIKLYCSKVWGEVDMSTTITNRMPSAENFTFNTGELWSDWLQGQKTIHYFHLVANRGPPAPILKGDPQQ
jgi:hypothetical protein